MSSSRVDADQQVGVVLFTPELLDSAIPTFEETGKGSFEQTQDLRRDHLTPVFGHQTTCNPIESTAYRSDITGLFGVLPDISEGYGRWQAISHIPDTGPTEDPFTVDGPAEVHLQRQGQRGP